MTINIRVHWNRTTSYSLVATPDTVRTALLDALAPGPDHGTWVERINAADSGQLAQIIADIPEWPEGGGPFDESEIFHWLGIHENAGTDGSPEIEEAATTDQTANT